MTVWQKIDSLSCVTYKNDDDDDNDDDDEGRMTMMINGGVQIRAALCRTAV